MVRPRLQAPRQRDEAGGMAEMRGDGSRSEEAGGAGVGENLVETGPGISGGSPRLDPCGKGGLCGVTPCGVDVAHRGGLSRQGR